MYKIVWYETILYICIQFWILNWIFSWYSITLFYLSTQLNTQSRILITLTIPSLLEERKEKNRKCPWIVNNQCQIPEPQLAESLLMSPLLISGVLREEPWGNPVAYEFALFSPCTVIVGDTATETDTFGNWCGLFWLAIGCGVVKWLWRSWFNPHVNDPRATTSSANLT